MNFDISTEQVGDDLYVISLSGEVDLYTAPEFKQELLDAIGKGAKEVVVDFSSTTFIDSTTLGVLVGGVKRLRTNDGQLSLVCSDRNITKIFEITGLDRVFTIYPTRDEADLGNLGPDPGVVRAGAAVLGVLAALLAAGCGTGGIVTSGDQTNGKQLFQAKCGGCHTLEAAGTHGTVGPNLDEAFASDRKQGFEQVTIQQVVRQQIALASGKMPADLVKGADADSVSAFVAASAGVPGQGGGGARRDERQGHLHGELRQLPHARGRRGPAERSARTSTSSSPPSRRVQHQVINGGAIMPAFKGQLTDAQIKAVAKYVSSSAGKK